MYDPEDRSLQEFFIETSLVRETELAIIYDAVWHTAPQTRQNKNFTMSRTTTNIDDLSMGLGLHPVTIRVGLSLLEKAEAIQHIGDEGRRISLQQANFDLEKIKQAIKTSQIHIQHRQAQLDRMIEYAETNACRRKIILSYFGDKGASTADECCDNCRAYNLPKQLPTETSVLSQDERIGLIILDCIRRQKTNLGRVKIAQILHGSDRSDIKNYHYDKNIYYARLKEFRQTEIEAIIDQLIEQGYIKKIGGNFPVIRVSPSGEAAVRNKEPINLSLPDRTSPHRRNRSTVYRKPGDTIMLTAQLFRQDLSIDDIAQKRGLARSTIFNHLECLIERGEVDVIQVGTPAARAQIETAIKAEGSSSSLSGIKARLPMDIEYGMIRCVIAAQHAEIDAAIVPEQAVDLYISKSHPRPLKGIWKEGWALGFHSRMGGKNWSRSEVGDLVYRLKYLGDQTTLTPLLEKTYELIINHPDLLEVDVLFPVPSTTIRSFDPVSSYCQALGEKFNKPVEIAIKKTRTARPQKEMKTLAQKRANVAKAFQLQTSVLNRRVLVVDDLFDSGATLSEITRLLLTSGAKIVNVLTLSSTIHTDA